jgi:hypothetical protein
VPGRTLRPSRGRGRLMLATARLQWDDGVRRLEGTDRRSARYRHLTLLVDAVLDELPRRVGRTFTLAELAAAYDGAEEWVRDVVVRETPPRAEAGIRDTVLVQDAAFGRYARGATDYAP